MFKNARSGTSEWPTIRPEYVSATPSGMYDRFAQSIWRSSIHTRSSSTCSYKSNWARLQDTNRQTEIVCYPSRATRCTCANVLFRSLGRLRPLCVSRSLPRCLLFTPLPFLAQEQPIPAELSFLNKIGKPYRITYEPWTEMQIPEGNREAAGLARWCAESIGSSRHRSRRHDGGCRLGHYQAGLPRPTDGPRCMSGQREESSCFFTTRKMGSRHGPKPTPARGTRLSGPD